jgi:prevent-host-death family protein
VKRLRPSQDVRPLAEFRAKLATVLNQVRRTRRPVIITQRGQSAAVLVSVQEYEALLDRIELLQDVRQAEGQLARGRGVPHSRARAQVQARLAS